MQQGKSKKVPVSLVQESTLQANKTETTPTQPQIIAIVHRAYESSYPMPDLIWGPLCEVEPISDTARVANN